LKNTINRPDGKSGKASAREVWVQILSEPIISPTRCQRLATTATFEVWGLAQSRGDGHRSLVTPGTVLSEYNEDLILI